MNEWEAEPAADMLGRIQGVFWWRKSQIAYHGNWKKVGKCYDMLIRRSFNRLPHFWNNFIPPKVSIYAWEAWHAKNLRYRRKLRKKV